MRKAKREPVLGPHLPERPGERNAWKRKHYQWQDRRRISTADRIITFEAMLNWVIHFQKVVETGPEGRGLWDSRGWFCPITRRRK